MQFYTKNHQHYCGIDLHTKMMYVCILNNLGEIVLHQNIPTDPAKFLKLIAPFREDLIIGVECIFSWYWLADVCEQQGLAFIFGPCLIYDKIVGNDFEQPKAGPKGKIQGRIL